MTDYGIVLQRVIHAALLCLRIDRIRRPSESEVSHLGNPGLRKSALRTAPRPSCYLREAHVQKRLACMWSLG